MSARGSDRLSRLLRSTCGDHIAMQMRSSAYWLFACLAVVALAGLPTVAAADDADTCAKQSGDVAIAACSRAIASGKFSGEELAAIYVSRGVEYKNKRGLDRAIVGFVSGNDPRSRQTDRHRHRWSCRRSRLHVRSSLRAVLWKRQGSRHGNSLELQMSSWTGWAKARMSPRRDRVHVRSWFRKDRPQVQRSRRRN